jgi:protoporphyrinogen oxidase
LIVILGAGLAGLTAAGHLRRAGRKDVRVLERESRAGGLCRSEQVSGYTFDYTGHFLHFRRPEVQSWVTSLCGDNLHQVIRRAWIYSGGVYTPYPFQANTHGLPTDVVKECVLGFVEATLKARVDGRTGSTTDDPEQSFEDWILSTLGTGIAKHFMFPYNTKLWTIPPKEMTTEWMGRFVPRPSLEEVVDGALVDRRDKPFGYNAHFWYPVSGGIQVLPNALVPEAGALELEREVTAIDYKKRRIELKDREPVEYETLISTMPLKSLVAMLRPTPDEIRGHGLKLRHKSVLSVNIGVEGRQLSEHNWVYFPGPETLFYRLGFPSNSSPNVTPKGASSVTAEVSYSDARPLGDRAAVIRQVRADLEKVGILRRGDRIGVEACFDIPCAYVLYDRERRRAVSAIHAFLSRHGIHSVGRYGGWEYSSMEDAIWSGKEVAERVASVEAAS